MFNAIPSSVNDVLPKMHLEGDVIAAWIMLSGSVLERGKCNLSVPQSPPHQELSEPKHNHKNINYA